MHIIGIELIDSEKDVIQNLCKKGIRQYRGKSILINSDHIVSIVPGEQDHFWIWISDGKEPVEITKEQNDKLLELIKAILVDTKWLMENLNRNDKMIAELADLIERGQK